MSTLFLLFQEFHLSQTYHEGLVKLQAKEYEKARELLESVLKDPLIANAQVDSSASDGHLLQLRFQSVHYILYTNLSTVLSLWHPHIVSISICSLMK